LYGTTAVLKGINSLLGIYLDSDLTMRTHVAKTVSGCFAVLRQLRSIRRSVLVPALQSLVVALVLTKLDYGSAMLAGLPAAQLDRLQTVLNAAARLIYRRRKFDHVSPLLEELHWLRVPERITFRLAVLAYRCQHNMAPRYLPAQPSEQCRSPAASTFVIVGRARCSSHQPRDHR